MSSSAEDVGRHLGELETHILGGEWADVLGDVATLSADVKEIWQGFEEGGGHLMAAESPRAAQDVVARCQAVSRAVAAKRGEFHAWASPESVGRPDWSKILGLVEQLLPLIISIIGA